jgi:hypothetical protein
MAWFEVFTWSLNQEFANQPTSIQLFEHFHPTRASKELGIFFINQSFTKSMKGGDIDSEGITANKAL